LRWTRCASFAASSTRSPYLHRLRRKRLGWAEAMMIQRHPRWRQFDLLECTTSASQQRLDPMVRAEVISLLKLLLNEHRAARTEAKGADDE
jgi:hypothetical protein